ncbi:MAG TPA: S53 family peptidase [Acidimicrobiales bacterium]|nr:S53 family peptidase [Acidimicrobiales bacterium]
MTTPRLSSRLAVFIAASLLPVSLAATTATTSQAAASGAGVRPGCLAFGLCYSPQAFRNAYGVAPLLDKGTDGKGRTVDIVDPTNGAVPATTSNIFATLSSYDSYFDLPPAHLSVVGRFDLGTPPEDANLEEVEDVEIVHAIAPAAEIRVILLPVQLQSPSEAAQSVLTGLAAFNDAIATGDVLSLSLGAEDSAFTAPQVRALHSLFQRAASRHITVTVASGDTGAAGPCSPWLAEERAVKETCYPASDPLVLAVGGTTLHADPKTGAYRSEPAWNSEDMASGGGFTRLFARPTYQAGVRGIGAQRGVPDVAADADPMSGLALFTGSSSPSLVAAQGTSAGAPFWAAIIALADQYAGHDLGFVNPAIYAIARGRNYHSAFHDIVSGNNTLGSGITGYQAGPGWDPVTGWGSPVASVLVPLLAGRHL